jgi:hypothetical protein
MGEPADSFHSPRKRGATKKTPVAALTGVRYFATGQTPSKNEKYGSNHCAGAYDFAGVPEGER